MFRLLPLLCLCAAACRGAPEALYAQPASVDLSEGVITDAVRAHVELLNQAAADRTVSEIELFTPQGPEGLSVEPVELPATIPGDGSLLLTIVATSLELPVVYDNDGNVVPPPPAELQVRWNHPTRAGGGVVHIPIYPGAPADCDVDGDGFLIAPCGGSDCDDSNAGVNPQAAETCNGIDDNCDAFIDHEAIDAPTWFTDEDGDGYGTDDSATTACLAPGDGWTTLGGDPADYDPLSFPGATERCNGRDDDADGLVDEDALEAVDWYQDSDGDGIGDSAVVQLACHAPAGFVGVGGDCNDSDSSVAPGQPELCNAVDDNCDGQLDEGFPQQTLYVDSDGDGFGTDGTGSTTCLRNGFSRVGADPDDSRAAVYPGSPERCDNGSDDDTDGLVDCEDADCFRHQVCATATTGWAATVHAGEGDLVRRSEVWQCPDPAVCGQDRGAVVRDLAMLGRIDGTVRFFDASTQTCSWELWAVAASHTVQRTTGATASGAVTFQSSATLTAPDALTRSQFAFEPDSASSASDPTPNCVAAEAPDGLLPTDLTPHGWQWGAQPPWYGGLGPVTAPFVGPEDCGDGCAVHWSGQRIDRLVPIGATGVCADGDPVVVYQDSDGDGWGRPDRGRASCFEGEPGWVPRTGDCDDGEARVHAHRPEQPWDDIDNDCDPTTLDGDADGDGFAAASRGGIDCDDGNPAIVPTGTWFTDADGDGFGVVPLCTWQPGSASLPGDCDDSNPAVNPDAIEVCADPVDDDCNGELACVIEAQTLAEGTGASIWPAGDIDQDGHADIAVVSAVSDAIRLYTGPFSGNLGSAAAVIGANAARSGLDLAAGADLDGSGDTALVVLASDPSPQHSAVLFFAAPTGVIDAGAAYAEARAPFATESLGSLAVGDTDGDGTQEVYVGTSNAGRSFVLDGPPVAEDLGQASSGILGGGAVITLTVVPDTDGDGIDELFQANAERGWLFRERPSGIVGVNERDVLFRDLVVRGRAQSAGVGDTDGDGYGELLIGDPERSAGLPGHGAVLLYTPGSGGSVQPSGARSRFEVHAGWEALWAELRDVGDVDGDGLNEFMAGRWLALSPQPGTWELGAVGNALSDDTLAIPSALGDIGGSALPEVGLATGSQVHLLRW